jgi:hypothetical protein
VHRVVDNMNVRLRSPYVHAPPQNGHDTEYMGAGGRAAVLLPECARRPAPPCPIMDVAPKCVMPPILAMAMAQRSPASALL